MIPTPVHQPADTGAPGRWSTTVVDLLATLIMWGYFTIGFTVWFAPFYLLAAAVCRDRTKAFQRLNHLFYRGFFLLGRVVMPRQRWHIDPTLKTVRGSVVVCNHVSYMDPLLLIALYPRHTTIVKNRLFAIPLFGWMLRLSGYIPAASRGRLAGQMIACMERMPDFLTAGGNLFVFPEGTRSRTGAMGAFNPGAFKIARLFRTTLTVVAIEGSDRLFTPGRFVFHAWRSNTTRVRLVARFTPDYDNPHFSMQTLIAQVRRYLSVPAQT